MSSSRRSVLFRSIAAGDMSDDIVGAITNVQYFDDVALQLSWKARQAKGWVELAEGLAAGEKVTLALHDFVAKLKYAVGTATANGVVAGDRLLVNLIAFEAVAADPDPEAHEYLLGQDDSETAANCAAAITAAAVTTGMTAVAVGAQINLTATVAGAAGNGLFLVDDGGHWTLSGGALAGAYDPAADEWPVEATLELSALALAAAVNASEDVAIAGVLTGAAAAVKVNFTAVTAGAAGDAIALSKTGAHLEVSGATFTGGELPTGKLNLEASLDYSPQTGAGTWTPLPTQLADAAQPTNNVGAKIVQWPAIGVPWVRPVYTATSGNGDLDVLLSAKGG